MKLPVVSRQLAVAEKQLEDDAENWRLTAGGW
jgi:hypothetical protein